jgi:TM2 domain-containing membrane protein YozV
MHPRETTAWPAGRLPRRRSAALATLLGWLCPGLGQLYVGQAQKAAVFLVAVLPAFVLGWWMTDFTGVNPRLYTLDFLAQAIAGGPAAAALHLSEGLTLDHLPRWMDVGRLYLAVGGLLNLVAICDALGEVVLHNRRVDGLRARRPAERAEPAAEEPLEATEAFPDAVADAPRPDAYPAADAAGPRQPEQREEWK